MSFQYQVVCPSLYCHRQLPANTHEDNRLDLQVRLTEIGLDTVCLVMDIVIVRIIGEQELQWVPPKPVSTMIIYRLDRRKCEQKDGLSCRQSSKSVGDGCSNRVE